MTDIELIKEILNKQIIGYLALKDILKEERRCLVEFRNSEIENLSKKKDLIVLKLRLLEEERLRILERLRSKLKTSSVLNLQTLYEITGDESFLDIKSRLLSLVQAVSELNDFNRVLIERSLNYFRGASSLIESLGIRTSGSSMNMEA